MLPKTQAHHHAQELTGIKGALHTVETGLRIYGSLRGVYEVGKAVAATLPRAAGALYQGAQVATAVAAPIVAGLL